MAYGSKYHVIHKETTNGNTTTYRIELQKNGFSGTSTELDGAGDIFKHDYEKIDPRKLFDNPIQKSRLELTIDVESSTELTILQNIFGSDEDEYRLVKKVDGSVVWTGKVLPDLLEYSEGPYPFDGTIIAKDLSHLSGIDFPLTDDRKTIIDTIADLLDDLGFGLDIYSYTNWITSDTTDSDDFLNQIYNERKALREFARTGDENDQAITNEEALERVLNNYGLILRQSDNAWRLYQLTELEDPTSVHEFRYDSTGTQQSTSSSVDITQSVSRSARFMLPTSINQINPAIKRAKVKFDHRTKVSNISFPDQVTLDDTAASEKSFSQFILSDGNQEIVFSAEIWADITENENNGRVQWTIEAAGYYWNDDDREWQSTGSFNGTNETSLTFIGPGANTSGASLWQGTIDLQTTKLPSDADGQITVTLRRALSDSNWALETRWEDAAFSIRNAIAKENSTSIDYQLTQSGGFSENYEHADTWFGDGPIGYSPAALRYGTGDSATTSDSWQFRGSTSYRNMHENLLKEILNPQRSATRNLKGQLWGKYNSKNVVSYNSDYLFFLGGAHIGRGDTRDGHFLELNIQTGSDTFEDIEKHTDETGSGSGSTSGGGGGGGGGLDQSTADARYAEESKNLSDLADIATARDNLGLTDGSADLDLNSVNINGSTFVDASRNITANQGTFADEVHFNTDDKGIIIGTASDAPRLATARSGAPGSLTVQPISGDAVGSVEIFPTGTADRSHFLACNAPDPDNMGFVKFEARIDGSDNYGLIRAAAKGTGSAPTKFVWENLPDGIRFEDDVVIGKNKTPSTALEVTHTSSNTGAIQVGDPDTPNASTGLFLNSTNFAVISSGTGSDIQISAGGNGGASGGLKVFSDDTIHTWGKVTDQAFSQGWQGDKWQIDADGNIEAESLFLRGGLTAFEAVINRVRYNFGDSVLSAGGGKVASVSGTAGSETITFEDPEGNAILPVAAGDLLLLQNWDLDRTTIIKRIWRRVSSISGTDVTLTTDADMPADTGSIAEGDEFVVNGNDGTTANRDAIIYSSVTQTTTPFIKIQDSINSYTDWTSDSTTKALMGDLTDAPDLANGKTPTGIGFFAKGNAYFEGEVVAQRGSIEQYLSAGGLVHLGNNLSSNFTLSAGGNIFVGTFNDDSLPLIRVNGADGTQDRVEIVGRSGTSSRFFGVQSGGNWVVEVSGDEAKFFGLQVDDSHIWTDDGSGTAGTFTGLQPRSSSSTRTFFSGADDNTGTNADFYIDGDGVNVTATLSTAPAIDQRIDWKSSGSSIAHIGGFNNSGQHGLNLQASDEINAIIDNTGTTGNDGFKVIIDDLVTSSGIFSVRKDSGGQTIITMSNLPTSSQGADALWNDNGTLKIG